MLLRSAAFTLLVSCTTLPALGQNASRDDFKEFASLVKGRWVGDVTLVYDWPGQERQTGDKITTYETFKLIADKNGIEWEHFGGNSTGRTIIAWDAASRRIRAFNVQSRGTTWQTIIWKESEAKWGWRLTGGGLADGREFTGAGHWLFSDGGKMLTLTGVMKVGDEEIPTFEDVYRRVAD